jgi:cysteine synthase
MGRGGGLSDSVLDAIGGTPLVELSRVTAGLDGRVLAKLDYLNPGGSKKDRIALRMIEDAERSGALRAGQTVVELTSGNTGTGLAIVCAVKGYPFVAVMSAGNSAERHQMMRALGAEVVLVEQQEGSLDGHVSGDDLALVEAEAQRIATDRGAFRADQFRLAGNPDAHADGTGAELWAQSGGRIDAFCEFVGSGGTFTGVARHLKAKQPGVACYVVEPGEPRCWPGRRSSIRPTGSRAAATPWPSSPCWSVTWSTGTCRSTTATPSTAPAAWHGRRGSSPGSRPGPAWWPPSDCSPARTPARRSPSCSRIPA